MILLPYMEKYRLSIKVHRFITGRLKKHRLRLLYPYSLNSIFWNKKVKNNKQLILSHIEMSWNKGELKQIENFLSESFYYKTTFTDEILNATQYINFIATLRKSMPNLSVDIELIMAEENHVMTQISFIGEVISPFYGIPSSNKIITFPAASIWEIEENKITSLDTLIDMTGVSRQTGFQVSPQIPLNTRNN